MRDTVRRLCALILPAVLALGLAGCTDKEAEAAAREAYDRAVREYEQQVKELDELRAQAEAAENTIDEYIAAVNATVNGESFALLDGSAEYTAEAVVPEGMKVDHWLINGERVDGGESISFPAEGNTVAEAVLRPEKILTAINCDIYIVDENDKIVDGPFTELNFEDMGSVSVRLYSETNDLTTIDHWIVNGRAIDVTYKHALEIYARDVTEATTFEPIFAACYLDHTAEDPYANGPIFQTIPLAYEKEDAE